mmetsp:Transcript_50353/g.108500  ORF Transcript_50353/g.108500 Transcript_50353/m.108500 type:complete len:220 (+) Transcript_50353:341-1000(+)
MGRQLGWGRESCESPSGGGNFGSRPGILELALSCFRTGLHGRAHELPMPGPGHRSGEGLPKSHRAAPKPGVPIQGPGVHGSRPPHHPRLDPRPGAGRGPCRRGQVRPLFGAGHALPEPVRDRHRRGPGGHERPRQLGVGSVRHSLPRLQALRPLQVRRLERLQRLEGREVCLPIWRLLLRLEGCEAPLHLRLDRLGRHPGLEIGRLGQVRARAGGVQRH